MNDKEKKIYKTDQMIAKNISNNGGTHLFVNMNDLNQQSEDFQNVANLELKEIVDKMANLKKDSGWEGVGSSAFFNKFDLYVKEMYKVCNKIEKYGIFLQEVSGSYSDVSDEVQKDFSNNMASMEDEKTSEWRI